MCLSHFVTKFRSVTMSQCSVTAKLKYAILQWANKGPWANELINWYSLLIHAVPGVYRSIIIQESGHYLLDRQLSECCCDEVGHCRLVLLTAAELMCLNTSWHYNLHQIAPQLLLPHVNPAGINKLKGISTFWSTGYTRHSFFLFHLIVNASSDPEPNGSFNILSL